MRPFYLLLPVTAALSADTEYTLWRSPKARFLRNEKIYRGKSYAYWFAIFTNVCIRFIWLGFIDSATGRNIRLRSFSASLSSDRAQLPVTDVRFYVYPVFYALEMLRRFQWNFCAP